MRRRAGEAGFTFVEVLSLVLVLGIVAFVTLPSYFRTQTNTKQTVRTSTVSAINTALSRFQFKHGGACPDQPGQPTFAAFLIDTSYFPEGAPTDPFTKDRSTFISNYSVATCRTK